MPRSTRSSRTAAAPAVDTLPQEPLFGITSDVFVPGISDATDSILAFLAEPGDVEPTFTNAPKVRNGSKASRKRSKRTTARKPSASRAVVAHSEVTATLQEVAEDTPAPKERKAAKPRKTPKGSLTVDPMPKAAQVPEGKLARIRWTVAYESLTADETLTYGKRFRFYRKAEAAADALVTRGHKVIITPERVLFTRKPKAA